MENHLPQEEGDVTGESIATCLDCDFSFEVAGEVETTFCPRCGSMHLFVMDMIIFEGIELRALGLDSLAEGWWSRFRNRVVAVLRGGR